MNERRINDKRIVEALERCKEATPGPWYWEWAYPGYLLIEGTPAEPKAVILDAKIEPGGNDANVIFGNSDDSYFIAHARIDLPDALCDLQDARAEIERLREGIESLRDMTGGDFVDDCCRRVNKVARAFLEGA